MVKCRAYNKASTICNLCIANECEYAVQNNMVPDETLRIMAENILALLEISTFNNYQVRSK